MVKIGCAKTIYIHRLSASTLFCRLFIKGVLYPVGYLFKFEIIQFIVDKLWIVYRFPIFFV